MKVRVEQWLDKLRHRLDLSQAEMADAMGITISVYSKLVSGATPMRPAHFLAACETGGVDVEQGLGEVHDFPQFDPVKLKKACFENEEKLREANVHLPGVSYFERGAIPREAKLRPIALALGLELKSFYTSFHELVRTSKNGNWRAQLQILRKRRKQKVRRVARGDKAERSTALIAARSAATQENRPSGRSGYVLVRMKASTFEALRQAIEGLDGSACEVYQS